MYFYGVLADFMNRIGFLSFSTVYKARYANGLSHCHKVLENLSYSNTPLQRHIKYSV